MEQVIGIYVPSNKDNTHIPNGGAMVGSPNDGMLLIDFEGNRYGEARLLRYEDRLYAAFDTHRLRRPTPDRTMMTPSRVTKVGHFHQIGDETWDPVITNPKALQDWLGDEMLLSSRWLVCKDKEGQREHAARLMKGHGRLNLPTSQLSALARRLQYMA